MFISNFEILVSNFEMLVSNFEILISKAEMNVSKAEMKYSLKDKGIFLSKRRHIHWAEMGHKSCFCPIFFFDRMIFRIFAS